MQTRSINRLHVTWLSQDLNGTIIYEVPVSFHAMTRSLPPARISFSFSAGGWFRQT